jgi:hypothetical protein
MLWLLDLDLDSVTRLDPQYPRRFEIHLLERFYWQRRKGRSSPFAAIIASAAQHRRAGSWPKRREQRFVAIKVAHKDLS